MLGASLLTLPNPFTTQIYDKGGAVFNVKAYGALGDGVTDDTAAVTAAVVAAAVNGGTVYFPQGIYIVNGVAINASNVTLMGAGPYATELRAKSANITVLNFGNLNNIANNGVRDLRINGNTLATVVGLNVNTVSGGGQTNSFFLDRVIIDNCPGGGLICTGIGNSWFRSLIMSFCGNVAATKPSVLLQSGGGQLCGGNHFDGLDIESSYYIQLQLVAGAKNNIFTSTILNPGPSNSNSLSVADAGNIFDGFVIQMSANANAIDMPTVASALGRYNQFSHGLIDMSGLTSGVAVNLVNSAGAAGQNTVSDVTIIGLPAGTTGIVDSMAGPNTIKVRFQAGVLGGTKFTITNTASWIQDGAAADLPVARTLVVGGSPFTYTNNDNRLENVVVQGGTVSQIGFIRGGVTTNTGLTSGVFTLAPLDALIVTDTGTPNMYVIPV